MLAFLTMNAADSILQITQEKYIKAGAFPISDFFIVPLINNLNTGSLIYI